MNGKENAARSAGWQRSRAVAQQRLHMRREIFSKHPWLRIRQVVFTGREMIMSVMRVARGAHAGCVLYLLSVRLSDPANCSERKKSLKSTYALCRSADASG